MAYRSSVHASTGFTPHLMLFGREMRVPVEIMYGIPPNAKLSPVQAVNEIKERMARCYERARQNLGLAQKRQKDFYDRKTQGQRYRIGNKVWLHMPPTAKDVPKFYKPWTGPWQVLRRMSDVVYQIKDLNSERKKVVHFDRLRPYTCGANGGKEEEE